MSVHLYIHGQYSKQGILAGSEYNHSFPLVAILSIFPSLCHVTVTHFSKCVQSIWVFAVCCSYTF